MQTPTTEQVTALQEAGAWPPEAIAPYVLPAVW